jgi:hydroxymethylglutaryl-CoA synthase
MAAGIVAWGAYVPYFRLERSAIGAALGAPAAKGTRAVASYDEDPTSMAVEAARIALVASGGAREFTSLSFTTTAPPYLDKTNATAVHAALGLRSSIAAFDFGGSVRSAFGALGRGQEQAMLGGRPLVTLADVRTGLPGGADERDGGDGAAAFVFASEGAVAEVVGVAHATSEFLDRWRVPGQVASGQWEERFSEHAYVPVGDAAVTDVLKTAGLSAADLDHVIVAGPSGRANRAVAKGIGARPEAYAPDLVAVIGNAGAAHLAIALADVLERATPGQTILALSLADGADAVVLRTTDALPAAQAAAGAGLAVAAQIAAGSKALSYNTFLTWREMLHREPPRRPDPVPPAAPPSLRREDWKFGFQGTRCEACGTRHLPPARVCVSCRAVDQMAPERMADVAATVATFTVDRLAFTLNPPVVAAVLDFDGGGRYSCELTDLDAAEVKIGLRVQMTFRKIYTAAGVHNYFWKAKPVRVAGPAPTAGGSK